MLEAPELSAVTVRPSPSRGMWRAIDRVLPESARASAEEVRRGRLFIAITALLVSSSWLFAALTWSSSDFHFGSGVALMVVGGVVAALNVPLARSLGSIDVPSWLVTLELVGFVLAIGAVGEGTGDPSQWFLAPAPLIAAILIGPRAGLVTFIVESVGGVLMWTAKSQLHVAFGARDDWDDFFNMFGSTVTFGVVAAIAYIYEVSRRNNLALVASTMAELKGKNGALEQLAREVSVARDNAVEESQKKGEFLARMRAFSETQVQAVERTRQATAQLGESIRAIASSVETLATSSAASDFTVDTMAESAGRVSQTSHTLVEGVEDASRALAALTSAVAAVQGQYDRLRGGAEATASAMLEMEQSAGRVEQRAARTVELSDAMIKDAERGHEAVRRTLAGVDDIRASARLAGEVIRTLEGRVGAIGAINRVIDEVAVETNVLALNASIIAAQAGERGQGFAVVADQMRQLAGRTARSTREISTAIQAVQSEAKNAVTAIAEGERAVDAGVALSEDAARALEEIVTSAREATEEVRSIEMATMAQATRAREVGEAMAEVNRLVADAFAATNAHGRASAEIDKAMATLRAIAPELEQRSQQQADGAISARAAIARISEMSRRLSSVHREQTRASDQTLKAIEELQRAQTGQDEALKTLGAKSS